MDLFALQSMANGPEITKNIRISESRFELLGFAVKIGVIDRLVVVMVTFRREFGAGSAGVAQHSVVLNTFITINKSYSAGSALKIPLKVGTVINIFAAILPSLTVIANYGVFPLEFFFLFDSSFWRKENLTFLGDPPPSEPYKNLKTSQFLKVTTHDLL